MSNVINGNAPAFSAYQSVQQTLSSNVWTKIQFQTKEFDTNSNFDNTTNYRFTPTIAGYYQFNGAVGANSYSTGIICAFYKNGSEFKRLFQSTASAYQGFGSALIYMNGTTDYVEFYGYFVTGQAVNNTNINTYFQASLVLGQ
jgi:hypothetical protein